MLKLEKRAEIEALHAGNVKESLTLEYKASGAIDSLTFKLHPIIVVYRLVSWTGVSSGRPTSKSKSAVRFGCHWALL